MADNLLFIDTSSFYAFLDKRDNKHKEVTAKLKSRKEIFVTSNYILDELITLFRVRDNAFDKFSPFIDGIWKGGNLQPFTRH